MHKHIENVRHDFNYSSADVNVFSESRIIHSERDLHYKLHEYNLFRNDAVSCSNVRPFGVTAVYSRVDYYPGYPYYYNENGIEVTILRFIIFTHVSIIAIYRSPRVLIVHLNQTLIHLDISHVYF